MRWNDVKCLACGRPSTKANTPYILCERNAITYIKDRGFPGGLVVKNSPANAGDTCLLPGSGRSPGGANGNPLQYSCLENFMVRQAWRATVHRVVQSLTWLKRPSSSSSSSIPLCIYTTSSLSIYLLMNTLIVSTCWLSLIVRQSFTINMMIIAPEVPGKAARQEIETSSVNVRNEKDKSVIICRW